jgi:hypothetical protein
MKLKFLHDSKYFNRDTAQEQLLKKGQTYEIPDTDVNAFLAGENPRAEVVAKEKKSVEEDQKAAPEVEAKAAPQATKKAKPRTTKKGRGK